LKTQQHFPNWLPCKERFISATTTCHLTQQQQLNILSSFRSSVLVQIQKRRREEEEEEDDDDDIDADEKESLKRNGCKMEVVRFRQFGGSFVIHITNLSFLVQETVREFKWRKGVLSFFFLIYSVFFFFSCLTGSNDLLKYHGWGFRRGVEPLFIYPFILMLWNRIFDFFFFWVW